MSRVLFCIRHVHLRDLGVYATAVSSTASPLYWESHILHQDGAGAAVVAVALAVAVVAVLGAALAATAAMVVV